MRRPRHWERLRQQVLLRDNGICWLCQQPGADSIDHVVPQAKRIDHSLLNLRAAHGSCNSRKRDRSVLPRAVISERWR